MQFGTHNISLANSCPNTSLPISCVKMSHKPVSGQALLWQFVRPPQGVLAALFGGKFAIGEL